MKKILILSVAAFLGCVANADLLYWQVNDSDIATQLNVSSYGYATISAVNGSNEKTILTSYGFPEDDPGLTQVSQSEFMGGTMGMYADLSGLSQNESSYSMLIELYNTNNELIGQSDAMDYDTWKTYISATEFSSNWQSMSVGLGAASGTNHYTAVPEPTSGLLMLLGAAMLGLRRRKIA